MNRTDLRQLAELRIQEAELLLNNSFFAGAYYMAGYAIECALKACIAKQTKRYDFPDKKLVKDVFTHNLQTLIKLAELEDPLIAKAKVSTDFADYWKVVKDWSEESRYRTLVAEQTARDLYRAITDRRNGVLSWLKKYW
ncbi:MAG TPA: HEPN domain-containing protein [Chloroflexia bacterium]|nr:HEPN domain-containing protein [Chloroflexia bacterium]